jgi:hypothetical protein
MNLWITIGIYILEGIFAVGLFGCVFVLVLATIDDVKVLFHSEHKPGPSPAPEHTAGLAHPPMHPQAR